MPYKDRASERERARRRRAAWSPERHEEEKRKARERAAARRADPVERDRINALARQRRAERGDEVRAIQRAQRARRLKRETVEEREIRLAKHRASDTASRRRAGRLAWAEYVERRRAAAVKREAERPAYTHVPVEIRDAWRNSHPNSIIRLKFPTHDALVRHYAEAA